MKEYEDITQSQFEEKIIDYVNYFNSCLKTHMAPEKADRISYFAASILKEFESYFYEEMERDHEQA